MHLLILGKVLCAPAGTHCVFWMSENTLHDAAGFIAVWYFSPTGSASFVF